MKGSLEPFKQRFIDYSIVEVFCSQIFIIKRTEIIGSCLKINVFFTYYCEKKNLTTIFLLFLVYQYPLFINTYHYYRLIPL